jgi:hypothetical protein
MLYMKVNETTGVVKTYDRFINIPAFEQKMFEQALTNEDKTTKVGSTEYAVIEPKV